MHASMNSECSEPERDTVGDVSLERDPIGEERHLDLITERDLVYAFRGLYELLGVQLKGGDA